MTSRLRIVNGVVFCVFWLLVLYAGADHPPPRGFILVIPLVLLCALVVYWRVPYYLRWISERRPRRILLVMGDGLLAGFILSILTMVATLIVGGEPSVDLRLLDRVIWVVVLCVMGLLNSVAIYFVNWVIVRVSVRLA